MTKQLKADLSLILVTVVWGSSFPIMSIALKSISPYSFIALRYILAAIIIGVISIKKLKNCNRIMVKSGVLIGLALGIGSILQAVGLVYTSSSKSGFITGLNVVMVPLFLAFLYKKFPDFKTIIGIVISVAGLGLMSISGDLGLNKGDFLTLLSAVCFAVQIILVDKYTENTDIAILTFVELLTVGIISLVPAVFVDGLKMDLNTFSFGSILFTAIFCTVFAYGLQNTAQMYTTPTHAAIIFLAEPVFSAIFSIFIGDKLTGKALLGCLLILLGMIVINLQLPKREKVRNEERKEEIA